MNNEQLNKFALDLEVVERQIRLGVSSIGTLWEAMEYSPTDPTEYTDVLWYLWNTLDDHARRLQQLTADMMEARKG